MANKPFTEKEENAAGNRLRLGQYKSAQEQAELTATYLNWPKAVWDALGK